MMTAIVSTKSAQFLGDRRLERANPESGHERGCGGGVVSGCGGTPQANPCAVRADGDEKQG